MKAKKILVPISCSKMGGSQMFLLKLIDGMKPDANFEFSVWLFETGPLESELLNRNIPYRIVNFSIRKNPLALLKMTKELKQSHADLVYLHAGRLLALAARLAKIPCVERINVARNHFNRGWCSYPLIDRVFTNFNTRAITVSEAIKHQLMHRGIDEKKLVVIRNFVELERFRQYEKKTLYRKELKIDADVLVVLNIGRFVPLKGQSDFLKIAAEALKSNPKLFFLLIGEGELEEQLKNEAENLHLTGHLKILPFDKKVEKLYGTSDILLHTAHTDSLANVLLEAMAAAMPVIASDVDGTCEVIDNQHTGLIFAASDLKKATELLLQVADDENLRKTLGTTARHYVETHHAPERVIDQYKDTFLSLMNK